MLVSGRTEPRKVIGSVSASEFLVSVAASLGFLINLGSQGIDWPIAGALLLGGAIAAPFAAWLVRRVAPRVLGTVVGAVIVITNSRTLFNQFELEGATEDLGLSGNRRRLSDRDVPSGERKQTRSRAVGAITETV